MKNQNTQHTPGPWRISYGFIYSVATEEYETVAQLHTRYCYMTNENTLGYVDYKNAEANAQLIARAPELLKENEQLEQKLKLAIAGRSDWEQNSMNIEKKLKKSEALNAEL